MISNEEIDYEQIIAILNDHKMTLKEIKQKLDNIEKLLNDRPNSQGNY